ncbi:hypothetical protein ACWCYY_16750 [Kitasatospora sp. NPDC001664]
MMTEDADGAHLSLTVARQPPHPDGTLVLDLTIAADLTIDRLETPSEREPVLTLYGPGSLDLGAPVYVAPDTVPVHAVAVIVAELTGGPEGNLRGVHSVLLTPDHLT